MSPERTQSGHSQQWWLSKKGTSTGPYDAASILDGLRTGGISPQTYACPVGGQTWKRLHEWPAFTAAIPTAAAPSPPPPPPPPPPETAWPSVAAPTAWETAGNTAPLVACADCGHEISSRAAACPRCGCPAPCGAPAGASQPGPAMYPAATLPRLPEMANWISIYSIIVTPILYAMGALLTLITWASLNEASSSAGATVLLDLFHMAIGLASTILLVLGGLRLKGLRFSGVTLLKVGLWISLISGAVCGFLEFTVGAADTGGAVSPSDTMEADVAIAAVFLPVAIAAFVFEIVALVWIIKHEQELPLVRDR